MPLILGWFRAFVLTLAVEELAAGWLLRRDVPWLRRIALIAVCNIASHPAVWLIFPELGAGLGWTRLTTLLVSEGWAFGSETLIYWLFLGPGRARRALLTATVANALSLALGLVLHVMKWL